MIIVIAKSKRTATTIAEMLGDRLESGQLMWISWSPDIRAVREAIVLSGGRAVAIGRYQFGFVSGFVLCGLLVGLYQAAIPVGEALYEWQAGAEIEVWEREQGLSSESELFEL